MLFLPRPPAVKVRRIAWLLAGSRASGGGGV